MSTLFSNYLGVMRVATKKMCARLVQPLKRFRKTDRQTKYVYIEDGSEVKTYFDTTVLTISPSSAPGISNLQTSLASPVPFSPYPVTYTMYFINTMYFMNPAIYTMYFMNPDLKQYNQHLFYLNYIFTWK